MESNFTACNTGMSGLMVILNDAQKYNPSAVASLTRQWISEHRYGLETRCRRAAFALHAGWRLAAAWIRRANVRTDFMLSNVVWEYACGAILVLFRQELSGWYRGRWRWP
jgi:hypothetical protein